MYACEACPTSSASSACPVSTCVCVRVCWCACIGKPAWTKVNQACVDGMHPRISVPIYTCPVCVCVCFCVPESVIRFDRARMRVCMVCMCVYLRMAHTSLPVLHHQHMIRHDERTLSMCTPLDTSTHPQCVSPFTQIRREAVTDRGCALRPACVCAGAAMPRIAAHTRGAGGRGAQGLCVCTCVCTSVSVCACV